MLDKIKKFLKIYWYHFIGIPLLSLFLVFIVRPVTGDGWLYTSIFIMLGVTYIVITNFLRDRNN